MDQLNEMHDLTYDNFLNSLIDIYKITGVSLVDNDDLKIMYKEFEKFIAEKRIKEEEYGKHQNTD